MNDREWEASIHAYSRTQKQKAKALCVLRLIQMNCKLRERVYNEGLAFDLAKFLSLATISCCRARFLAWLLQACASRIIADSPLHKNMFTMAKIKDGSTYLGEHLCKNDYYNKGEENVKGKWVGKLADYWQLSGSIEAGNQVFEALRNNRAPDGIEKLTMRDRGANAVRFYDFQCSAQKSVSIMAVLMDDQRLRDAHERASTIAFAELESFAARHISGLIDIRENTGKVLAAAFTHDASRELDPQLHTHFVIANVTVAENGKRYALETYEMLKAVRYSGKVYQNEMAWACKELGYEIELIRDDKRRVTGFEIVGVTEELRELFSKRRAQVEDGIEEFRRKYNREPNTEEIHDITVATRSNRYVLNEISTAEVRAYQLGQLTPEGKEHLGKVYNDSRERKFPPVAGHEKEAWSYAVEHTFERVTVSPTHKLMAEAINGNLGQVDLLELKKQFASDKSVKELTGKGLQAQVCTIDALRREELAIIFVNDTKGIREPLRAGELTIDDRLAPEQKKGIEFVCKSKDQVMAIRGIAGAGKTTMLKELDRNLNHVNRLYLAPTASAVAVLKAEGFQATTVSDYLNKCSNFQEPPEWKGALVVVDEAGMLSQKQGSQILKYAGSHVNRVLLVGDVKQHSSVEAGDFLRVLETHSKLATHTLADIRRQKPPEYNAAIRLMSQSQCIQGLHALDELGWVHENGVGYLRNAAESYLEKRKEGSVLAVTPTWKENYALTDLIRAGLKEEGVHRGTSVQRETLQSLKWTVAQKCLASNYEPGQWVVASHGKAGQIEHGKVKQVASVERAHLVFTDGTKLNVRQHGHQIDVVNHRVLEIQEGDKLQLMGNDKKLGLFNGDVYTVKSLNPDGSIGTTEGKTIPKDFLGISHGYVLTSHKSQGKTADHVIVAAENLRSKACYVACSRGRESATVHTVEKDRLFSGLPQSEDRLSVSDVLKVTQEQTRGKRVEAVLKEYEADRNRNRISATVVPHREPESLADEMSKGKFQVEFDLVGLTELFLKGSRQAQGPDFVQL